MKFSGKPGRISFLPGLPGEFLANKKCLEKVPQKFLNISEVKHWRWKWQLQTWFFQSPPQGRLLFQILTFLGSDSFWLFWHHLNSDMETPWCVQKKAPEEHWYLCDGNQALKSKSVKCLPSNRVSQVLRARVFVTSDYFFIFSFHNFCYKPWVMLKSYFRTGYTLEQWEAGIGKVSNSTNRNPNRNKIGAVRFRRSIFSKYSEPYGSGVDG